MERTTASPYQWKYLFQGGVLDAATGLYQFGFRDYDPSSGVWMQRDPIGLAGGDLNLYRFVGNNPVALIDPSGLIDWAWWGNIAASSAQVAGGVLEVGGGIALGSTVGWSGVGLLPAGAMGLHGADNIQAGLSGIWNGAPQNTLTNSAVTAGAKQAGMSDTAAGWTGTIVDGAVPAISGAWAASVAKNAAREAAEAAARKAAAEAASRKAAREALDADLAKYCVDPGKQLPGPPSRPQLPAPTKPVRPASNGSQVGAELNPGVTFGHGARHLEGSGLSQATVESAIEGAVRDAPNAGTHWGWVQVEGQWIQYRAFVLSDDAVNVGTYVRVPKNISNARVP